MGNLPFLLVLLTCCAYSNVDSTSFLTMCKRKEPFGELSFSCPEVGQPTKWKKCCDAEEGGQRCCVDPNDPDDDSMASTYSIIGGVVVGIMALCTITFYCYLCPCCPLHKSRVQKRNRNAKAPSVAYNAAETEDNVIDSNKFDTSLVPDVNPAGYVAHPMLPQPNYQPQPSYPQAPGYPPVAGSPAPFSYSPQPVYPVAPVGFAPAEPGYPPTQAPDSGNPPPYPGQQYPPHYPPQYPPTFPPQSLQQGFAPQVDYAAQPGYPPPQPV